MEDSPPPLRRVMTRYEMKEQNKNKLIGTADYIAPEVIKQQEHTFRVDFWSLGIVTYELLTGALPFNDDTPEKIFKNILRRQI